MKPASGLASTLGIGQIFIGKDAKIGAYCNVAQGVTSVSLAAGHREGRHDLRPHDAQTERRSRRHRIAVPTDATADRIVLEIDHNKELLACATSALSQGVVANHEARGLSGARNTGVVREKSHWVWIIGSRRPSSGRMNLTSSYRGRAASIATPDNQLVQLRMTAHSRVSSRSGSERVLIMNLGRLSLALLTVLTISVAPVSRSGAQPGGGPGEAQSDAERRALFLRGAQLWPVYCNTCHNARPGASFPRPSGE